MEFELNEIIHTETTPDFKKEMTKDEHDKIVILIEAGIYPRDIFIEYNFPLEWAIQVQEELKPKEEISNELPIIADEI